MNMNKKGRKLLKIIGICIGVVAIVTIATYLLWWYGCFLPRWIIWNCDGASFGEGYVALEGRRVTLRVGGETDRGNAAEEDGDAGYGNAATAGRKTGTVVWKTQGDWFVQDLVIKDIDRDGQEELILLVWKHGSYGEHMPFWVEKNDKALKQHIFIYKFEAKRESKIRAIWMSSQIEYEITDISSGEGSYLNVTDRTGNTRVWMWREFGLKLVQ